MRTLGQLVSVFLCCASLCNGQHNLQQSQLDLRYPYGLRHRPIDEPAGTLDSNLTLVGDWPEGFCMTVALHQDTIALVGNGKKVQLLNVVNPEAPTLLSEYTTTGEVNDIRVYDSIAYVIVYNRLLLLDISDPHYPQKLSESSGSGSWLLRLWVDFPYVYASGYSRVCVFNVADPLSPYIEGWTGSSEYSDEIVARSGRAYMGYVTGDAYGGFDVIDCTNPALPHYGMFVMTKGTTPTLAVHDTLLYAGYSRWLSDSSYALMLGTYSIRNPDTPRILQIDTIAIREGEWSAALQASSMSLSDDSTTIYFASWDSGMYRVDVRTLGNHYPIIGHAQRSENFPLRGRVRAASSAKVAAQTTWNGVWFVMPQSDSTITSASFYLTGYWSGKSLLFKDKYLVISEDIGGFVVLDISDPTNPTKVSALELPRRIQLPLSGSSSFITLKGDYLYLDSQNSIEIANLSDVYHPRWVGYVPMTYSLQLPFLYTTLLADSGFLYTVHGDTTFAIYNIDRPDNPTFVGSVKLPQLGGDMIRIANCVYVTHYYDGGLTVVDVSTPEHPQLVRSLLSSCFYFHRQDTIVYVSGQYAIYLMTVARPDSPVVIDSVASRRFSGGILTSSDNYLYSLQNSDLLAFDISDPRHPVGRGSLTWEGDGVSTQGKYVFLSHLYLGMKVFRNDLITGVDERRLLVPHQFNLVQNYPNPFNPSTVIRYALPVIGWVTLKVYDVLGREVTTLVNEVQHAGEHAVNWDASGLPSGVYYYRLESDGRQRQTRKMILLR